MNIIDEKSLLSEAQKTLFTECAQKPFKLGNYASLDDIVTRQNVDVIIEPGIPKRSVDDYYNEAMAYWNKVVENLKERMREDESLLNEYRKASEKYEKLFSERKTHASMMLLGLYDSQKNIIILYPEAMESADASSMDEYLVSTLAHEVMHAYFNRPGHESFPYAMFVEEPLAEFGMLLYVHETHSINYNWAHDNVSKKNCCYRYGADIMDQYIGGDYSLRKYLEDYKILIGEYEMPDISNGKVFLPKKVKPVNISGKTFIPQWQDIINNPPRYFYDIPTETLGLDGNWSDRYSHYIHNIYSVKNLYLGDNFFVDNYRRYVYGFFDFDTVDCNIVVSPANKYYKLENGIVMSNTNGEVAPIYKLCDHDKYRIPQNGKCGIFDCRGTQIAPCKYDFIWTFNNNGLCKVSIGNLYGYVNEHGKEQIPVEYEKIYNFENGVTTAKKNGFYGLIDEHNNIVHPFDLDYLYMREIRNGYAPIEDRTGKWGSIDTTGKVAIPCIYDSLFHFDAAGIAKVELNGEEYTIDKFGNRI
jgi:hypothetical protein